MLYAMPKCMPKTWQKVLQKNKNNDIVVLKDKIMKELKYKFSFIQTIKKIPWFLWVLLTISLIQIFCIQYNFGLAIFDENMSSIVLNICYAILASFIFYYFIEVLPRTKKEYYGL